jgi:hypothetical protein
MSLTASVSTPSAEAVAPKGDSAAPTIDAPAGATYGWEMFIAFAAAVVGISFVVCVLALNGSWVMLGVALVAHMAVTAAMMKLVLGAFGSEDHAYPDGHAAEAASRAALARLKAGAPAVAPSAVAVPVALEA